MSTPPAVSLIETPERLAFYDRRLDGAEARDVSAAEPEPLRIARRELELFLDRAAREWTRTRALSEGARGEQRPTSEACEKLRALGYVDRCP